MDVKSPQGFLDKVKMLPMLAEMGELFPEDCFEWALQGGHQEGKFLAVRFPHPAMLAARWRTVYYLAVRYHARSENGEAQRGRLSNAGVRRDLYGDALAAT